MHFLLKKTVFLHCLYLFFVPFYVNGQSVTQSAWQNKTDYNIKVSLDETENKLFCSEEITYYNYSPKEINSIFIHLWPNAYRNNKTDFAQQLTSQGKTNFSGSYESDKGSIDGLNFAVGGMAVAWRFDPNHQDIAELLLRNPLKPGESIVITTPFTVKIPKQFSRMGHNNKQYQITQWYPKVAVYDTNGWNAFSYLNQGEFYSDFGKYDVTITLPESYVVAATGILQTPSEIAFLESKAAEDSKTYDQKNSKIPDAVMDAEKLKTIRFLQDSVVDFAWFADRRYQVAKGNCTLKSGKKIDIWIFNRFNKSTAELAFMTKGLKYYSEHIGDYPYPSATVVVGPLSAGGGMEYPMITIMNKPDQTVIVHELGHNWFMGILASNEHRYPWMDEGLNSFYEEGCLNAGRYPLLDPNFIEQFQDEKTLITAMLNHLNTLNEDIALGSSSADFSSLQYGAVVYKKTAILFIYLQDYLGKDIFERCMKSYFKQWAFKHPLPGDIKQVFETVSGKDLDWFFDDIIDKNIKSEIAIKGYNSKTKSLHLRNKSDLKAPTQLTLSYLGTTVYQSWIPSFSKDTSVVVPGVEADEIAINVNDAMPERNLHNNLLTLRGKRFRSWEDINLKFPFSVGQKRHHNINIAPAIGSNGYDGFMAGAVLYNSIVPAGRFQFVATPLFGTKSKKLAGYFNFLYNQPLQHAKLYRLEIGVKNALFSYDNLVDVPEYKTTSSQYLRIKPYARLYVKPHGKFYNKAEQFVQADVNMVSLMYPGSSDSGNYVGKSGASFINFFYSYNNLLPQKTFRFKAGIEYKFSNDTAISGNYENHFKELLIKNDFARLHAMVENYFPYGIKEQGLRLSLKAGFLLFNNSTNVFYRPHLGANTSAFDYQYDHTLTARSASPSIFAGRQLIDDRPGLNVPLEIGISGNRFIVSAHAVTGLPVPGLPLKLYGEMAIMEQNKFLGSGLTQAYAAGVCVSLRGLTIYAPLVFSSNVNDAFDANAPSFGSRIVFTLLLTDLNFHNMLNQLLR